MSYSLSVVGKNKLDAKAQIPAEFDRIVMPSQPAHAHDRDAAIANACTMVDLLSRDANEDEAVYVSMSGSLSWGAPYDAEEKVYTAANCSASVAINRKPI